MMLKTPLPKQRKYPFYFYLCITDINVLDILLILLIEIKHSVTLQSTVLPFRVLNLVSFRLVSLIAYPT